MGLEEVDTRLRNLDRCWAIPTPGKAIVLDPGEALFVISYACYASLA